MNGLKRAVALGYFDGLHIGHGQVLGRALDGAERGLVPSVLVFDVPPSEAVTGVKTARLMTDAERDEALKKVGMELLYISFEEIRNMTAAEFVKTVLCERFNAAEVFCGFNYTFGRFGAGNSDTLIEECGKVGIKAFVCDEVMSGTELVSSTAIRKYIENGNIERANEMLGYTFGFCSTVFSGDHRGRLLGFPTINQYLPDKLVVPKFGVYASVAEVNGAVYSGVTNIGNRPTFDGDSMRSETFILGFNGDLYGQSVTVRLVSYIRGEMKFASAEELKNQIVKDERRAAAETERILHEIHGVTLGKRRE